MRRLFLQMMCRSRSPTPSTRLLAGLASSPSLFFDAQRANAARVRPPCATPPPTAPIAGRTSSKATSPTSTATRPTARKIELAKTSTNPDLTNYQKETLALVGEMEEVLGLDIYDMTREKRISQLKKDSNVWAGKYAPAGRQRPPPAGHFTTPSNQVAAGTLTRTDRTSARVSIGEW